MVSSSGAAPDILIKNIRAISTETPITPQEKILINVLNDLLDMGFIF